MKYLYLLLIGSIVFGQVKTDSRKLKKMATDIKAEQISQKSAALQLAKKNNWDLTQTNDLLVGLEHGIPIFVGVESEDQARTTNADLLYDGTLGGVTATGNGMTLYEWDGGKVRTTHQEFSGRATYASGQTSTLNNHATAVASMMIAEGIKPEVRGLAYEANLIAYDFTDNFTEIANESANNTDYMISNHSYGYQAGWRSGEYGKGSGWYWFGYPSMDENESVLHGYYSSNDSLFDAISYNAPNHLIVKSIGNDRGLGPSSGAAHWAWDDLGEWVSSTTPRPKNCGYTGYDCIPYGAMSKNILTVGAIEKITSRYSVPGDVVLWSGSAFGPTDDGRIKPDVVAVGNKVDYATSGSDIATGVSGGGTSFSAPNVTGIAALLQQIKYDQDGGYLSASELKALFINSAQESGDADGPDYRFGFGLVDAFRAGKTMVDALTNEAVILYDHLSNGEEFTLDLKEIASSNEVKATLVWLDPASSPNAFIMNNRTPVIINDLDMRITTDSSTEMKPWILDVENPGNAAIRGDNTVDNVEQIQFDSFDTDYTLTINHKGTLAASQSFALVISGLGIDNMGTQETEAKNTVTVSPNPTKDIVYINSDESQSTVKIFNMVGQLVQKETLTKNQSEINISALEKGVYVFMIQSKKRTIVKKIIKE